MSKPCFGFFREGHTSWGNPWYNEGSIGKDLSEKVIIMDV